MNIICGINPVVEALSSGTRHFDRLLVAKGLRNRRVSEAMKLASQKGVPLRFETRETLDRLAGDVPHQGLVAVVSAKPVMSLQSLLEESRSPALLVVLDGVEDPRNLGAILRTVEASGADGVLLPERHTAGLSETVARASAGGLEHVRVARIGNVAQALETLKERGLWIVGFDAAGTERWDAIDLRRPVALVFGGEDRGIRRLVREKCDHLASLPLFGHVGSLNVSVVAGIALYEAIRQREAVPSHVRPIPPGAAPPREPLAAAGDEAWDEADEANEKGALVFIEEHDALAWTPPVVLTHVGARSRKNRGHREERRLHQRPRPASRPPAAGEGAAPGAGGGGGGERPRQGAPGRRRRRKGRRPAEGQGERTAPPAGGAPGPTESAASSGRDEGAPREGAPEGGENRPSRGRNGRRRHRRRRRPPSAPSNGS